MIPLAGAISLLSGLGYATTQNKDFGITDAGNNSQSAAKHFVAEFCYLKCDGIACFCLIQNVFGGKVFDTAQGGGSVTGGKEPLSLIDNSGGGSILLQTAVLAAAANGGFIGIYFQVTDFTA